MRSAPTVRKRRCYDRGIQMSKHKFDRREIFWLSVLSTVVVALFSLQTAVGDPPANWDTWAVTTLVSMAIMFVLAVVLLPLYNRFG